MKEVQLMLPAPVDMQHKAELCCVATVMTCAQRETRMCDEEMQVLLPEPHCTQQTRCIICFHLCRHVSALTEQIKQKVEATEQSTCP